MWPRIGFLSVFFVLLSGFTPPTLPSESRGVYRFEPVVAHAAPGKSSSMWRTLDGGGFSLIVGIQEPSLRPGARHRERAQELIDRVAAMLKGFDESANSAEISIGRVYPGIREVVVNVVVHDAAKVDSVHADLVRLLSHAQGVAFAGEARKASVE